MATTAAQRGEGGWRARAAAAVPVLLLWLALTGAAPGLLVPGLLLALAVWAGNPLRHWPGLRLPSPLHLVLYLPGFVWRSFMGGLDVARRVFDPRLPIRPGFYRHHAETDGPAARASHMGAISLLPGSLGVGLENGSDVIHLLTDEPAARAAIAAEERRIVQVFGRGRNP